MDRKGTQSHKGERNPRARLRAEQVRSIIDHVRFGWSHRTVAEWFGVERSHVTGIMIGRKWRHVR